MKPYRETTSYTSAAACLLMLLHHKNQNITLSEENERAIWRAAAILPTRACSLFALASHAKKQGQDPIIITEGTEYSFPDYRFYRYTKNDVDIAAKNEQFFHAQAQKEQITILQKELTTKEIDTILEQAPVMLRLNVKKLRSLKRNSSNYIIVHAKTPTHYQIIDPALGALSMPKNELEEAFTSLSEQKYRDHRLLFLK